MALTDSLISYWKLDEASGSALDAHGSNTLTENGTGGIASTTGKISNCRDFEVADSDYFSKADNADLSTGDIDWTIAAWVQIESKGSGDDREITSKGDTDSFEFAFDFCFADDRFRLRVCSGASFANLTTVLANNFGSPSTATWYHVVCWHDSVNNVIGISVNAGTANTTAYSAGTFDSTKEFRIGGYNGFGGIHWDGLIDEVGFWKRVLTSGERTSLYNSGSGLAYPFSSGVVIPVFMNQYRQRVA